MAQTKTRPTSGRGKARSTTAKAKASKPHVSANGASGNGAVKAMRKAKTPLLAGGAAVAGAAGGLALGVRQARKSKMLRRPMVKIDSHDLAKAAKNVGDFGVHVGELASELRKNRERA